MTRARTLLAAAALLAFLPAFAQPASESLERDARAASRAGKFREAAVKFEQAATAASEPQRRGRLRMQASYAALNAGNAKDARESLTAAFADDPALEIVEQLFTPEFRKLWHDVKAEVVKAAPAALPDLAELKRTSEEKLKDGRFAEVVYDLGNFPHDKLDRDAWALLAQAYERSGRSDQAALARRRALGESVPIAPLPAPAPPSASTLPAGGSSATDLLAFGREALNRGDALTAQAAANRVVEMEPSSSEGYRLLGDSYARRGERALADAMWRQSLRLDERNEGTLLALAGVTLEEKLFDEALEFLRRAVELNPINADRLTTLGRKARSEGDAKMARQVFAAAARALPNEVAVLAEYGAVLFEAGDVDAALEPLMSAASLAPDRAPRPREPRGRAPEEGLSPRGRAGIPRGAPGGLLVAPRPAWAGSAPPRHRSACRRGGAAQDGPRGRARRLRHSPRALPRATPRRRSRRGRCHACGHHFRERRDASERGGSGRLCRGALGRCAGPVREGAGGRRRPPGRRRELREGRRGRARRRRARRTAPGAPSAAEALTRPVRRQAGGRPSSTSASRRLETRKAVAPQITCPFRW